MHEASAASLLRAAAQRLSAQGIDTAALDARLLLQAALACEHADLIARPEAVPSEAQRAMFEDFMARRAAREPVSRILGWREFYGRRFAVSPEVLDPRPDTETLIDTALAIGRRRPVGRMIDLGTGSGIIALTLLAEWPHAIAVACDASPGALKVARSNAEALGVAARVSFLQTDWWKGIGGRFDLIVSNPPYIERDAISHLAADVRQHDPLLALDGGEDGLDCYRAIAAGAPARLAPEGTILVEIGIGQAAGVAAVFSAHGLRPSGTWNDLAGITRVAAFQKEGR